MPKYTSTTMDVTAAFPKQYHPVERNNYGWDTGGCQQNKMVVFV